MLQYFLYFCFILSHNCSQLHNAVSLSSVLVVLISFCTLSAPLKWNMFCVYCFQWDINKNIHSLTKAQSMCTVNKRSKLVFYVSLSSEAQMRTGPKQCKTSIHIKKNKYPTNSDCQQHYLCQQVICFQNLPKEEVLACVALQALHQLM